MKLKKKRNSVPCAVNAVKMLQADVQFKLGGGGGVIFLKMQRLSQELS